MGKKPHPAFHALIVVLALLASAPANTLNAQVIYDGNGASTFGDDGASLPFTVPAGTDRLLVISVCTNGTLSNVTYNGTGATLAITDNLVSIGTVFSSIYYIPLGSGGMINSIITATGIGFIGVGAGSFQNIDQTQPLGNTISTNSDATGFLSNPSLTVPSTAGNLVFDKSFNQFSTPTPDISQTSVFVGPIGIGSSFKIASASTTQMSYSLPAIQAYTYCVAEFVASSDETNINQVVASLNEYINSANINSSIARAITRRLDLAANKYCLYGSLSSAISTLNYIISYVEYQSGNGIPTADADYIIGEVQALISALNNGTVVCDPVPNRPGGSNVINTELELAAGTQLFPNPAGSTINLSVGDAVSRPTLIRIYSMQGQLMVQRQYPSLEAGKLTFDVDQFLPGIYNLVVAVDGEMPVTKKFEVQR